VAILRHYILQKYLTLKEEPVNKRNIIIKLKVLPTIIMCTIVITLVSDKTSLLHRNMLVNASLYLKENDLEFCYKAVWKKLKKLTSYKPHYFIDYGNLLLMQENITQNTILDSSKKI
jgi:hypothetical protein